MQADTMLSLDKVPCWLVITFTLTILLVSAGILVVLLVVMIPVCQSFCPGQKNIRVCGQ
jgi:hypothetical protein